VKDSAYKIFTLSPVDVPRSQISSTNKTEILLKVALNPVNHKP